MGSVVIGLSGVNRTGVIHEYIMSSSCMCGDSQIEEEGESVKIKGVSMVSETVGGSGDGI